MTTKLIKSDEEANCKEAINDLKQLLKLLEMNIHTETSPQQYKVMLRVLENYFSGEY